MNRPYPSLAELRAQELGGPDAKIGNILARRFARPLAIYGTWAAVRLGMTAHQLTLLALVASLASAAAIGSGSRTGFVAGASLGLLAFWLDRVDGQVARWRGTAGLSGVYLDYLMHHLATMALGFSLGYGLAMRTGMIFWAAAGFLVAAGWTFLSLQNDCRYKSFVQPLKRSRQSYRVEGGAGGRPSPAPTWPTAWPGIVTWPAYTSCEPYAVLLAVLGLAALAIAWPTAWEWAWPAYVVGMTIGAPLLATARITRAVRRQAVEEEFARWFQPDPMSDGPRDASGGPHLTGTSRSARMDGERGRKDERSATRFERPLPEP